eukprot:CAMPEP_0173383024 /NCGR_PEP_ID=MMETSP1356-20130122/5548_1 /TAXON_ID=77927 ORGANISM="Hemiselmis virescens, Strain PCC157" /NCGR_SAMPLE_ID=MMETSP1356 /ASSEMBLY_ACC=CAM_ASM_000847 /LENGTH=341 /DNA_ID=CAMNT_0014337665 /DNA_START=291 /DNA_END=1316 /DNA_ORIENTATION=-
MAENNAQVPYGLFSLMPSVNVGDPYGDVTKKTGKDPRAGGRQFTVNRPKKGKTPDVTFSVFQTLAVGDPYVELEVQKRRARNENLKHQIVATPFRPANPTKRPVGHGSYYGSFGIWQNMKTTDEYDKKKKSQMDGPSLKNMVTSPPKKGTYGMIGTNIGGKPEGSMGEYKYVADPVKRPETAPGEKLKAFIPSSPPKKGTYGFMHTNINGARTPHGSQGEYTYVPDPIHMAKRSAEESEPVKPFRPSQPPRKGRGYNGTFKWSGQEYIEDPEKDKWDKMMAEKKANRERNMGLTFKPSSHPKSMRTVSVANLPRNQAGGHPAAVNARIFASRHGGRAQTAG